MTTVEKKSKHKITSGSIIVSPMFRRFLTPIILTLVGFAFAVYFFTVPFLKNMVYSLEEKSVQTSLNNIHKLIEANALAIEAYKQSVTSSHKRQIKNITLFMETYLKNKYDQVQKGIISEDEAQLTALEELRAFRYGNNDYVWVSDYQGFFLSHPDPKMNMENFSQVRDVFGNYVLAPLISQAMENSEGYHSVWWQRLENDLPAEKLTHAKLFPQWEWVIGTGVYLDDLEAEIILRKEMMIEELRQILKPITIAQTGYMYIFDSWNNILVHPDAEFENMSISSWVNPSTRNRLVDDLVDASHEEDNKVAYMWNQPDDKTNYIYNKIDWVTHVDAFDWYVVASVYTDELNTSSVHLRNRILFLAGAVVLFSIIIVSLLMSRLLNPIRRLSSTAGLVEAGDLTARSDVEGGDEIGLLSRAFNSMIARLRETIEKLDQKVLDRTQDLNQANKELTSSIGKLEHHNWRMTELNNMAENLQTCNSLEETYVVIWQYLLGFFPNTSGVLYMCSDGKNNEQLLTPVRKWGEHKQLFSEHQLHECKSIREGRVVLSEVPENGASPCEHIRAEAPYLSICMPLFNQKKVLGMINLISTGIGQELLPGEYDQMVENWQLLSKSIADQLALALDNMILREKLQDLSVRDSLTGLFNRRYMEETLTREFMRAERSNNPVGIIILDVDFFKKVNDTYGHEAGDLVLVELARLLSVSIRKGDVVCRYGGEEFLLVLPTTSMSKTIERAETIRAKVEKLKIQHNKQTLQVTASLGTAVFPDHGSSPDEVVKVADDALYRAKEEGRNRAALA
jgi:diguanylate cyclase (GGDEF)-like protein